MCLCVCVQDPARDPGYWSTSRMLLEAAICLAQQTEEAKLIGLTIPSTLSVHALPRANFVTHTP